MRSARHRRLIPALVALALSLFAGVGPVAAEDQIVTIQAFLFKPDSVTVQVGDTVTWKNMDPDAHTATDLDGSFDTGFILGGGKTAEVTFNTAGTFEYFCKPHVGMRGTIVVEAAAAEPSAAASTQPDTSTVSAGQPGGGPAGLPLALLLLGAMAFFVALGRLGRERIS